LDTINRIFKLHDSNDGNFGFIDTTPSGNSSPLLIDQAMAKRWLIQKHEFKIVDFFAPENTNSKDTPNENTPNENIPNENTSNKDTQNNCYVVDDIFNTFLSGNTVTKYLKDRLMDVVICRHFDYIKDEELERKYKEEKIFFGKQVIQSLDQRFSKFGGLRPLLFQAKADLESFLRKEKCEEISDEFLKEGLEDIKKYIDGIVQNYAELKEAIEKEAIEESAIKESAIEESAIEESAIETSADE